MGMKLVQFPNWSFVISQLKFKFLVNLTCEIYEKLILHEI